jgi:hypothetical protein
MYNWIDYNNDGVQQLNEFVIALYPDQKLFIRIFTPSDDYVKVNNVNFNQTIGFEPGHFFKKTKAHFLQNSVKSYPTNLPYKYPTKYSIVPA